LAEIWRWRVPAPGIIRRIGARDFRRLSRPRSCAARSPSRLTSAEVERGGIGYGRPAGHRHGRDEVAVKLADQDAAARHAAAVELRESAQSVVVGGLRLSDREGVEMP